MLNLKLIFRTPESLRLPLLFVFGQQRHSPSCVNIWTFQRLFWNYEEFLDQIASVKTVQIDAIKNLLLYFWTFSRQTNHMVTMSRTPLPNCKVYGPRVRVLVLGWGFRSHIVNMYYFFKKSFILRMDIQQTIKAHDYDYHGGV